MSERMTDERLADIEETASILEGQTVHIRPHEELIHELLQALKAEQEKVEELEDTIKEMKAWMQKEVHSIGPKPDFKEMAYWDVFINDMEQKDERKAITT